MARRIRPSSCFRWWLRTRAQSPDGGARLIYCPYTDREVATSKSSSEHIVPLALGGVNGFEVRVDRDFNLQVGSELDGKLANEFLWALQRTEFDARGHSGRRPVATTKRATYGHGRSAQVHFHKKRGLRVWDERDRKDKTAVGPIRISTSLNVDLPVRFAAKVALGAGFNVYGDLFREHVDHRQLRDVMRTDPAKLDLALGPDELGLEHLTLRVDHYLRDTSDDSDSAIPELRALCSSIRGSAVILAPGRGCFGVAVGLLGRFLGFVNVPATTKSFPNEGDYAWGHVVSLADKRIRKLSLRTALIDLVGISEHPRESWFPLVRAV